MHSAAILATSRWSRSPPVTLQLFQRCVHFVDELLIAERRANRSKRASARDDQRGIRGSLDVGRYADFLEAATGERTDRRAVGDEHVEAGVETQEIAKVPATARSLPNDRCAEAPLHHVGEHFGGGERSRAREHVHRYIRVDTAAWRVRRRPCFCAAVIESIERRPQERGPFEEIRDHQLNETLVPSAVASEVD